MVIFTPNTVIKSADINLNFVSAVDILNLENPYIVSAYKSADTNVTDITSQKVICNTEIFDPSNSFNTTTGEFTTPVTGYYFLKAKAFLYDATNLYYASLQLNKSGAAMETDRLYTFGGTFKDTMLRCEGLFYLTAGNVIDYYAYGDTTDGGTWQLGGDAAGTGTRFEAILMTT